MILWMRKHKFESHLIVFALMVLASIGLYLSLDANRNLGVYTFIGIFAVANLLAMAVK